MAMTNAERQKRYRDAQKAKGLKRDWLDPKKTSWESELKAEKLKAARAADRKMIREKNQGVVEGICLAAAFFIGHHRTDIAQHLLTNYYIDREKAVSILKTKNPTLATLDRAKAWDPPPKIIVF